jgi:hypothetical protein
VLKNARLQALSMLTLERTLQNRKLLDAVAVPTSRSLIKSQDDAHAVSGSKNGSRGGDESLVGQQGGSSW